MKLKIPESGYPGFYFRRRRTGSKADLVITDPTLTEISRRKQMSPSTAKSLLKNCPASWFYGKVFEGEELDFAATTLGTATHTTLEDFYGLQGEERTYRFMLDRIVELSHERFPDEADDEQRQQWVNTVLSFAAPVFQIDVDPAQIEILARELRVEGEVDGVPFLCVIDRISIDPDGNVEVVDYKSSKSIYRQGGADSNSDQIVLNAVFLEAAGHEFQPTRGRFFYTRLGKTTEVDLSEESKAAARKMLVKAWNAHNRFHDKGVFPTNTSGLCGGCPLVNYCPSAAAQGKGPRDFRSTEPLEIGDAVIPVLDFDEEFDPALLRMDSAGQGAVHHDDDPIDHEKEPAMAPKTTSKPASKDAAKALTPMSSEAVPYHMLTTDDRGDEVLNPNSYAARQLSGLLSVSLRACRAATKGDPVPAAQLESVYRTVVWVIQEAQRAWVGTVDPQAGSFTRLHGLLMTQIEHDPIPAGDPEDLRQWAEETVGFLVSMVELALDTFDDPPTQSEEPWAEPWQ